MTEIKTNKQDVFVITLNNKWEIEFWTNKLGVNEERLKKAIKNSGSGATEVIKWLNNN